MSGRARVARRLSAFGAFAVCAALARADASQAPAPAPQSSAAAEARSAVLERERAARIAAWTEALELDRASEVLAAGERDCAPGGVCADDGVALALFARALFASGAEERALALVQRPVADAAGARALRLAAARFALARDELTRALELLCAPRAESAAAPCTPRDPDVAESAFLLGSTLVRAGRAAEAKAALERFVAAAPRDPDAPAALHMLAQIALAERDLERARGWRARADASAEWQAFYRVRRLQLREHPDDPLPRFGLAELWIAVEDWPRARAELAELGRRAPGFGRGWSLLGDLERRARSFDAAEACYARALAAEPALPEALVGRARLALALGKPADARADLERWAASPAADEPRFLAAHLDLARALAALGETSAAETRHARYRALGGTEPLAPR